jgi:hypothetical protein
MRTLRSLSGVFCHVHAAAKYDIISSRRARRELCEAFGASCKKRKRPQALSFLWMDYT